MKFFPHLKQVLMSGGLGLTLNGTAFAVPQSLVESLGDEGFQQREAAQRELSTWAKGKGKEAFNQLKKLKQSSKSPEVKMRLETVLDGMDIYEPIEGTRGFIGIGMNPMLGSVRVRSVQVGSPAEKKGLKVGDEIIKIDEVDLRELNADVSQASNFLSDYVKKKNAGDKLELKIRRGEEELDIELKLADYDKMGAANLINPGRNGAIPDVQLLRQLNQLRQLDIQPNAAIEGMNLKLEFGGGEHLDMLLKVQDKTIKELQKKLKEQQNREQDGVKLLKGNFEKELLKMRQDQGGNDKKRTDELLEQLNGKNQPESPEKPHAEVEPEPAQPKSAQPE